MTDFQLAEIKDLNKWDEFVDRSPQGTIFCHSKYLACLPVRYCLYGAFKGQELCAATILLFDDHGLVLPAPYYFTPYQGILFRNLLHLKEYKKIEENFACLTFLINELTNKYESLSFSNFPTLIDVRPFQWHNYGEDKPHFCINLRYTPILNIHNQSFDDYLACIKPSRRQEYKKSVNYKIEETDDVELLNRLHLATFTKNSVTRSKIEETILKTITQNAIKHKFGRLSVIYTEEGPASCYLFLKDNKRSYYLFAGNDPNQRDNGAGTALLLDNIRHTKEQWGLSEVDFVGCNSPQRGYFKLSFGGELKQYYEVKYNNSF